MKDIKSRSEDARHRREAVADLRVSNPLSVGLSPAVGVSPYALILRMATLLPFCQKPFGCAISHKNGVWQLIPRPKDSLCTCSLRYIGNGRAMRWGGCDRGDALGQLSRPRSDRDLRWTNQLQAAPSSDQKSQLKLHSTD
jgi:hypothetical protein